MKALPATRAIVDALRAGASPGEVAGTLGVPLDVVLEISAQPLARVSPGALRTGLLRRPYDHSARR